jgi:hypothetical protein
MAENSSESRIVTEAAPPWRVLQVNSEWCSVSGYTEAQWLGNTCRILQGPETCQRTVQVLNDALRAQRPITVRMINYRADQTPFVNDLTIVPMPEKAAPGTATHFVGIMRDHSLLEAVPRALVAPPCANMPASHPLSAQSAQLLHPPSGAAALQPTAQLEAQMALQQKTLQLLQARMKAQPAQGQPAQARPLLQPPFSGLPAAPAAGPAAVAPETSGAQGVAAGGAGKGEAAGAASFLWAAASAAPTAAAAAQDLVQVAAAQLAAVAALTTSIAAAPQTDPAAVAAAAPPLPARDEGDGANGSGGTRVPPFLTKLYKIVQQPQPDDNVGWCDDGLSFRVSDPAKFAARVLPRYFKHNKLGSFQQQLLTYGFQRLPNGSCLDISSVWMHPCFRRSQHHLLDSIQRAPAKSTAKPAGSSNSSTSSSGSSSSGQTVVLEEEEEEAPPALHHVQAQLGSIQSSLHQLSSDMRTARSVEMQVLEALAERVCKRKRPSSSSSSSLQGPGPLPMKASAASSAAGSSRDDDTVAFSATTDNGYGSASARSDGSGSGDYGRSGDGGDGGDGGDSGDGTLEAGTDSEAMPSAVGKGEAATVQGM